MRYTSRILKPALPLYQGPGTRERQSHKILSFSSPGEKEFYMRRVAELELELQSLNFLDHALKIVGICHQIRYLRNEIALGEE